MRIASASGAETKGFDSQRVPIIIVILIDNRPLECRAFFLPDIKLILVGPILFRQFFVHQCPVFRFGKKVII